MNIMQILIMIRGDRKKQEREETKTSPHSPRKQKSTNRVTRKQVDADPDSESANHNPKNLEPGSEPTNRIPNDDLKRKLNQIQNEP